MQNSDFSTLLQNDFNQLTEVFANGVFAAYLLGYDESNEENRAKLNTVRAKSNFSFLSNFADGEDDNRTEKAGPVDLRFDVVPEEAIDYFKRKKIVTKKEFDKLSTEGKSGAFHVSDIYRKDVLTAFHQEITDALESGQTSKQVVKGFKEILEGLGHAELGDFHLETIVRSNMMTAYGVGRRRAMEESSDLLPFWEYSAVNDDRTRPTHRALDGIIFPANHEFWDTHFPPWGFNCRCSIIARLDTPDGYDHARPNPDTNIAFDKDGLPAKAEYLTQVYDLKATNFVGVPKIASLEDVLKETAKRVETTRRERDNYKTPQTVIDLAKQLRGEKTEVAHFFDKDGNHLVTKRGDAHTVEFEFTDQEAAQLIGGINLHNHPGSVTRKYESFSLDDITTAADWQFSEALVVTKKYLYSMRPPKAGWDETWIQKITDSFNQFDAKILKDFFDSYRIGEFTKSEIKDLVRHKVWNSVAKELGLRYKRRKI